MSESISLLHVATRAGYSLIKASRAGGTVSSGHNLVTVSFIIKAIVNGCLVKYILSCEDYWLVRSHCFYRNIAVMPSVMILCVCNRSTRPYDSGNKNSYFLIISVFCSSVRSLGDDLGPFLIYFQME